MAITLQTTIANRHKAFVGATGASDEIILAAASNERIRVLVITIAADSNAIGVVTFGASAGTKTVLPFNVLAGNSVDVVYPGGLISDVQGDDLIINVASGTVRGIVNFEICRSI